MQALEPEKDAKGALVLNPDGSARLKTVDAGRAGVTIPYSPEFADLESNTPLLRRLAEITGGGFHTEAPEDLAKMIADGELFRDPPASTRAILPFWFWLVFAAAVMLLWDVALRRIAVETNEIKAMAQRLWTFLRHSSGDADVGETLDRLTKRKLSTTANLDTGRKAKRFDAATATTLDAATCRGG